MPVPAFYAFHAKHENLVSEKEPQILTPMFTDSLIALFLQNSLSFQPCLPLKKDFRIMWKGFPDGGALNW